MRAARGDLGKDEFLQQVLSSMKTCYLSTVNEISKLDVIMAQEFTAVSAEQFGMIQASFSKCGQCSQIDVT